MSLKLHARTIAALAGVVGLVATPAVALSAPAGAASGAPSYQLNDVACVKASFCIAVGSAALRSSSSDSASRAVIEQWDGTRWSLVASPTGKGSALQGITCLSKTFCIAVGVQGATGPGVAKTLALRWNGTKWSLLSTPNPSGAHGAHFAALNDVSCSSTTNCKAMGLYSTGQGYSPTLAERWHGSTWSIVASPNQSLGGDGQWLGVACPVANTCLAVGEDGIGLQDRPSLEAARWNGTAWSLVGATSPTRAYAGFTGVSCLGATNCFGVGWSITGSVFQPDPSKTLVEHWNGTKWSIVPSSVGGTTASQLNGISCAAANKCIAVGSYAVPGDANGRQRTLALRWNGTKWTKLASPNPSGATGTLLASVSCVSATNCTAVGHSTATSGDGTVKVGPFSTLVEKWNGTTWSIVATPKPPTPTP
jgi:hypothetical protein